MRLIERAQHVWLSQRGHMMPWTPVALGAGIGLYFALRFEPGVFHYLLLAGLAAGLALLAWRSGALLSPILGGLALIAAGVLLAGARANMVAAPVLGWRYYGPVEGRVIGVDRSASDALRLTLDRVVLTDVAPARTPARVRVSLHAPHDGVSPEPGQRVIMTAHLSPPSGPAEPRGFDFRRHAWFKGLGAVGYTRTPVLALAPPTGEQWLFKARMALSQRVQAELPGEAGAFAAAIITGDRSGIGRQTLEALRRSNLAHLLAISGLHMGLLAGVVFGLVRLLLAAVPRLGLRVSGKKIAALAALLAAAGYLALSGGNVATERAFVMVAVMLCAVLADRRALSLRAVAVAALIVLLLQPEALLGPGFQMSFAATAALVAVFALIRDRELALGPRWLRPAVAVVVSSLVAGLATAPFAAAHFNQIAHYGLPANLLTVPLMGVLVMPAALLAVCLMPLGLEAPALWVMGQGLDWILGVAHWVSALEGARGMAVSPGHAVLPLITLGALFVILWQGRLRVAGVLPVAAGFWLWSATERPEVLIAESGGLVGVMTQEGRALSRAKGSGFVAGIWLENDGDAASQPQAHARWPAQEARLWPVSARPGKHAAAALQDCQPGEWVVLTAAAAATAVQELPCEILSPERLRHTGAVALIARDGQLVAETARDVSGIRLWNAWAYE